MIKNRYPKLMGLLVLSLSTCFAGTCSTGLRDAVMTGFFDYASGTVTETLGSVISVSDLLNDTTGGE